MNYKRIMKYLFDENCSVKKKFLADHPGYENVKYKLGEGTKDETILQRTNKEEYVIVTKDIDCALDALIAGFKVIYHDEDKKKGNFLSAPKLDEAIISEFQKIRPHIKV